MKVSELTGAQLDYWVARASGDDTAYVNEDKGCVYAKFFGSTVRYAPSQVWEHGGPIIERERLQISPAGSDWAAASENVGVEEGGWSLGPTPLIAAMRAFVASKLGEEV